MLWPEGETADGRSDEHQLRDPVRMVEGEIDGDRTAHRASDQVRGFQAKLIDEREQVFDRRSRDGRQL